MRIELDAFGWYLVTWKGRTLQAFRTERECRQWWADTYRIRMCLEMGVRT